MCVCRTKSEMKNCEKLDEEEEEEEDKDGNWH